MNDFTNKELKELGLSRELTNRWFSIMDFLYKWGLQRYGSKCKNGTNEILINDWTIAAYYVNSKFITVNVVKKSVEYLSLRVDGLDLKKIGQIVYFFLEPGTETKKATQ